MQLPGVLMTIDDIERALLGVVDMRNLTKPDTFDALRWPVAIAGHAGALHPACTRPGQPCGV
jgi:hypothetical protein